MSSLAALRALLALALLAPWITAPALAATRQELNNDLSYYRRTADRQKMDANDRLYILHRLRQKYADSGLDLAELDQELARQESARAGKAPASGGHAGSGLAAGAPSVASGAAPGGAGQPGPRRTRTAGAWLEQVRREDGPDGLAKVVLSLSEPVVPRAVRVDVPERPGKPRLLIDLPRTRNRLSAVSRDMRWSEGPLASVAASESGQGVRVQVDLNADLAYRVLRAGRTVVVEVRPATPWASPEAARALRSPAPETEARLLRTGDVLDISVEPARELSRRTEVLPDGTIEFPLAGPLFVREMRPEWVEKALAQKLGAHVPRPRVTVRLADDAGRAPGPPEGPPGKTAAPKPPPDSVFVIGQVVHPGHYPYQPGATLLDVVSRAGGVAGRAGKVKIFRQAAGRREVLEADLGRVLQGHAENDLALQAGDIVLVPQRARASGGGSPWLPWLTLATLVAAVVLAA